MLGARPSKRRPPPGSANVLQDWLLWSPGLFHRFIVVHVPEVFCSNSCEGLWVKLKLASGSKNVQKEKVEIKKV